LTKPPTLLLIQTLKKISITQNLKALTILVSCKRRKAQVQLVIETVSNTRPLRWTAFLRLDLPQLEVVIICLHPQLHLL
jgi:hypothetical protein